MVPRFFFLSLLTVACSVSFLHAQEKSLNLFGDNEAKGPTVITASEQATFDSPNHLAIFIGTVEVQDPQFNMTCDKLTVTLNKVEGGIKQADAEGTVLIVTTRKDKNGGPDEVSTGKGDKAVYTPGDGRIALYGSPQIRQGNNTHIATEPGTKMYLYKDGRLKTEGASRTVIESAKKADNALK